MASDLFQLANGRATSSNSPTGETGQTLSSSYPSPHTSSSPAMLTSETALLELVGPLRTSETVVLSPTFESVTAQIAPPQTFFSTTHDGSRVVPASIEGNNQSLVSGPSQLQQFPIPEVKSPTNPSDDLAQAPEKFVPSLGTWAKPLFFKSPVTPSKPSTPRDYDPTIVGNQLAALWPTLNDEILNKQPKALNRAICTGQTHQLTFLIAHLRYLFLLG
ncbi:hypothetical protein HID58_079604 [Brassica napus]|uniref:Uncharacterized protein n=1 Tax=Brassica napus TaxID=3708 RepID=A0ABQ7Y4Y8_BRANA|nr:hypothetical protein HID58_079604 [Brassica napus]